MILAVDRDTNETLERAISATNGAGDRVRVGLTICALSSPLGTLLLGTQDGALALLEFFAVDRLERDLVRLQERYGNEIRIGSDAVMQRATSQLQDYFAGTLREFELPLKYRGSDFQEKVWAELRKIPYGTTCSYGAIAQRVGDSGAMRAVGAANHHNPIAIVIPCHRVVNANGDLGGYGGGLWRKRWLLDLEFGQGQLLL